MSVVTCEVAYDMGKRAARNGDYYDSVPEHFSVKERELWRVAFDEEMERLMSSDESMFL